MSRDHHGPRAAHAAPAVLRREARRGRGAVRGADIVRARSLDWCPAGCAVGQERRVGAGETLLSCRAQLRCVCAPESGRRRRRHESTTNTSRPCQGRRYECAAYRAATDAAMDSRGTPTRRGAVQRRTRRRSGQPNGARCGPRAHCSASSWCTHKPRRRARAACACDARDDGPGYSGAAHGRPPCRVGAHAYRLAVGAWRGGDTELCTRRIRLAQHRTHAPVDACTRHNSARGAQQRTSHRTWYRHRRYRSSCAARRTHHAQLARTPHCGHEP